METASDGVGLSGSTLQDSHRVRVEQFERRLQKGVRLRPLAHAGRLQAIWKRGCGPAYGSARHHGRFPARISATLTTFGCTVDSPASVDDKGSATPVNTGR
jgi:hypothetical protein